MFLPTLYDDLIQINIKKLKEWGCLHPHQTSRGTISWMVDSKTTNSVSIISNTKKHPYIQLDYKYKNQSISYKIFLTQVPSNLGKGFIWYFQCPETGLMCRKLYFLNGYFLHREAYADCMYECQTRSKKYREIEKAYGGYFKLDNLYDLLYKKYFKRTYAGKPTRRCLKLMNEIKEIENQLETSNQYSFK